MLMCRCCSLHLAQFILLSFILSWRNVDKDHSNRSIRILGSCLRRKIDQSCKEVFSEFKLILKTQFDKYTAIINQI